MPLPRRPLGRTGLVAAEVGLGTAALGLRYGLGGRAAPRAAGAADVVRAAIDAGIDFIDTAPGYRAAERIVGRALRGRRERVVLATKVGAGDDVHASLARSLRALATDRVEFLQVHNLRGADLGRDDLFAALERARRSGLARFVGATVYGAGDARAAAADPRIDLVQVACNLVQRDDLGACRRAGGGRIAIVARSVLLKGVLGGGPVPPGLAVLAREADRLGRIAARAGRDLPALALGFVLAQPGVAVALVGPRTLAELRAALRGHARGPLDPRLGARLARRRVPRGVRAVADPRAWREVP